jgi:hypothetical protein
MTTIQSYRLSQKLQKFSTIWGFRLPLGIWLPLQSARPEYVKIETRSLACATYLYSVAAAVCVVI